MYGHVVVAATKRLQNTVSSSLSEAEYVAVSETAKAIVWLQNVLYRLGSPQQSTHVYQDNADCIEWTTGGAEEHFKKWKYIDVRYSYIVQ